MDKNTTETSTQPMSSKDISDEAIRDANARLISILNAAVDALVIIDQHGKIELVNAATEMMFLYTREELIGQNVNLLMPSHFKDKHNQYISSYIASRKPKVIGKGRMLQATKSDGSEFPVFISVGEVQASSHTQFVGIIRDISLEEKSRIEIQEIRDKLAHVSGLNSMGELAAGIAHEINQPLSAISSYAQASKRMILSPESDNKELVISALDKICNQAIRANEVINHLRSLVKKRVAQRQNVLLNTLINETVSLAKVDTRILDHDIILDLTSSKPPELNVDPIQIQQVLLNFIRNAIDAMEDSKGMPLTIRSHWLSDEVVEVSVIDSGHGMDANMSDNVFTPFFTTKETGMGMGLAISQTIIHAHGGRIYCKPNVPKGSIFSFSLSIAASSQKNSEQ